MDADGVREILRRAAGKAGSQKRWCEANNISPAYVSEFMRGQVEPGPMILDALGIGREIVYARKGKPKPASPSDFDCSDPEIRKQAAWELERKPAGWAQRWGEALLRYADEPENAAKVADLEAELTELEGRHNEALTELTGVVRRIRSIADHPETPGETCSQLYGIIETLEDIS